MTTTTLAVEITRLADGTAIIIHQLDDKLVRQQTLKVTEVVDLEVMLRKAVETETIRFDSRVTSRAALDAFESIAGAVRGELQP